MKVAFDVPGIPVTQGSTRAFVVKGRAIVTHDKRADLLSWRNAIGFAAKEAARGAYADRGTPVDIRVTFALPRPKSAPKRVVRPTTKPDIDKLARGVLDALTGVLFADDSQVVALNVSKCFAEDAPETAIWVSWV